MAVSEPVVLIIEDEPRMRQVLRTSLQGQGYFIVEAASAREGIAQASGRNPALILLDLGLPDSDGLNVTRTLRTITAAPIIVISARGQERDKVAALDLGADDYLTKPFGMVELHARMRAALRHAAARFPEPANAPFAAAGVRVDRALRRVWRGSDEVHLTPTEYKLLEMLVASVGRVLTHRQLLTEVWGSSFAEQTHYLRVYMGQLRHKLEADPARPRLLITEPGVGYRLVGEPSAPTA